MMTKTDSEVPQGNQDGLCPACLQGISAKQTKLNQVSKLCRKHTAELDKQLSQRLAETGADDE